MDPITFHNQPISGAPLQGHWLAAPCKSVTLQWSSRSLYLTWYPITLDIRTWKVIGSLRFLHSIIYWSRASADLDLCYRRIGQFMRFPGKAPLPVYQFSFTIVWFYTEGVFTRAGWSHFNVHILYFRFLTVNITLKDIQSGTKKTPPPENGYTFFFGFKSLSICKEWTKTII